MKYKGIEIGIPSVGMIEECIIMMGFKNLNAEKIYNHYSKRKWKTNKGTDIVSLEAIVSAKNGIVNKGSSKKENQKKTKREKKKTPTKKTSRLVSTRAINKELREKVLRYDTLHYALDNGFILSLKGKTNKNVDWIVCTMMENREKSPMPEIYIGDFLIRNNIDFIHQAPFIIDDNIYFADFFIPSKRCIIEVDGGYHYQIGQIIKDSDRENKFKSIGINTIRIPNEFARYDSEVEKFFPIV